MADQSIELTAYDPTWPVRFAEQQTRLAALLKPWLADEREPTILRFMLATPSRRRARPVTIIWSLMASTPGGVAETE